MILFCNLYQKTVLKLHIIYLLYAIPMIVVAIFFTPPFQNPDEPSHYSRAEQLSRFEFIPVFKYDYSTSAQSKPKNVDSIFEPDHGGFKVDRGVLDAAGIIAPVAGHGDVKLSTDMITRMKSVAWGGGYTYSNSGNTAIYPPTGYIMPALGVFIGKFFRLSVVNTLYLARCFSALLSLLLCFYALKIARRSTIPMFIVLLFPMSIALCASISHDSVLIASSFLFIAIIDRAEFDRLRYHNADIMLLTILISVIVIAKPPYILFLPLFLFLKLSTRQKTLCLVSVILTLAGWLSLDHANLSIRFAPAQQHINAKLQIEHAWHHPFKFMEMVFAPGWAQVKSVLQMLVGVLGWLDLSFPLLYYCVAYFILFIGLYISFSRPMFDNIKLRVTLIVCAVSSFVAILAAQYTTWTALDAGYINGMQGRYLLPICPLILLAISNKTQDKTVRRSTMVLFSLIILFPIYSAATISLGLNKRYYRDNTLQQQGHQAVVTTSQKNQHLCTL